MKRFNYLIGIEIDAPAGVEEDPNFDELVMELTDDCVDLAKDTFAQFEDVRINAKN